MNLETGSEPGANVVLLPGGRLPQKATDGAAGFDVYARAPKRIRITSKGMAVIPLGFSIALPRGYEAQIRGRSGLATKSRLLCHVGTIDADFRGEVGAIIFNFCSKSFHVSDGMRIAQLVIQKLPAVVLWQVDKLDETERGAAGFGSTGV